MSDARRTPPAPALNLVTLAAGSDIVLLDAADGSDADQPQRLAGAGSHKQQVGVVAAGRPTSPGPSAAAARAAAAGDASRASAAAAPESVTALEALLARSSPSHGGGGGDGDDDDGAEDLRATYKRLLHAQQQHGQSAALPHVTPSAAALLNTASARGRAAATAARLGAERGAARGRRRGVGAGRTGSAASGRSLSPTGASRTESPAQGAAAPAAASAGAATPSSARATIVARAVAAGSVPRGAGGARVAESSPSSASPLRDALVEAQIACFEASERAERQALLGEAAVYFSQRSALVGRETSDQWFAPTVWSAREQPS